MDAFGIFDDAHHGCGIGSLFESVAKFLIVKKLGDIGEGMEMLLELALGNEKEHDEIDRLIIERIKIDALFGTAKGADDLVNEIGGGVGNANAETNPGAHGGFALFDDRSDLVPVLGLDLAAIDKAADQFINRFPPVGGFQVDDDLISIEDVTEGHRSGLNPNPSGHFARMRDAYQEQFRRMEAKGLI